MRFYHRGDPPPFEGLPEPAVKALTLVTGSQPGPYKPGELGHQPSDNKKRVKSISDLALCRNVRIIGVCMRGEYVILKLFFVFLRYGIYLHTSGV